MGVTMKEERGAPQRFFSSRHLENQFRVFLVRGI